VRGEGLLLSGCWSREERCYREQREWDGGAAMEARDNALRQADTLMSGMACGHEAIIVG
jgi:hypothetical protein